MSEVVKWEEPFRLNHATGLGRRRRETATAATTTIVQVSDVVPTGDLDPEAIVTPSIYVDRVVQVEARHYTVQGAR